METRAGRSLYRGQQWLMRRLVKTGLYDGDEYDPEKDGVCHGVACVATEEFLSSNLDQFDKQFTLAHNIPITRFNEQTVKKRVGDNIWDNINDLLNRVSSYQYDTNFDNYLQGISCIDRHCGVYHQWELIQYLNSFSEAVNQTHSVGDKPVAFKLSTSEHEIFIGYHAEKNTWFFIDANQLPSKHFDNTFELARKITHALFAKYDTLFTTKIYCNNADKSVFEEAINLWKTNIVWQQMHEVTREKATITDDGKGNWLILALELGQIDTATLLIKNGAHVNQQEKLNNDFPLHLAAKNGYVEIVQMLCEHGADLKLCRDPGITAFRTAQSNGHTEVMKILLEYEDDINQADTKGKTPLHFAAIHHQTSIMEFLLDNGANPNVAEYNQKTPLFYAIRNNNIEGVKLLLEHNAATTTRITKNKTWFIGSATHPAGRALLNKKPLISDCISLTLEEFAIIQGHYEIAELLRKHREQRTVLFRPSLKRKREDDIHEEQIIVKHARKENL
jgi:uncharacterized protein